MDAGLRRPFRALIEVLDRVVPQGNLKVCEWMVLILQKGVEEEQEIALARVTDLQQNWDRSAAIDLIMDRLFSLKDPGKWNDTCESGEKFMMKALAGAAWQDGGTLFLGPAWIFQTSMLRSWDCECPFCIIGIGFYCGQI